MGAGVEICSVGQPFGLGKIRFAEPPGRMSVDDVGGELVGVCQQEPVTDPQAMGLHLSVRLHPRRKPGVNIDAVIVSDDEGELLHPLYVSLRDNRKVRLAAAPTVGLERLVAAVLEPTGDHFGIAAPIRVDHHELVVALEARHPCGASHQGFDYQAAVGAPIHIVAEEDNSPNVTRRVRGYRRGGPL
jgi:hypothetical protein